MENNAKFKTLKSGLGNGLLIHGKFRPLIIVPSFTSESGEGDHLECPILWALKKEYNPYLFSMMELITPITISGKTFTPIVELAKIADCHWVTDPILKGIEVVHDDGCYVFTVHWEKADSFEFSFSDDENRTTPEIESKNDPFTMIIKGKDGNYPIMNPMRVIEKMHEWHFNVHRVLPEQYIQITPQNNPYK